MQLEMISRNMCKVTREIKHCQCDGSFVEHLLAVPVPSKLCPTYLPTYLLPTYLIFTHQLHLSDAHKLCAYQHTNFPRAVGNDNSPPSSNSSFPFKFQPTRKSLGTLSHPMIFIHRQTCLERHTHTIDFVLLQVQSA